MIHKQPCDSCGMDGFHRPAILTFDGLALCRSCIYRAETFAGFPTWTQRQKDELADWIRHDALHAPVSVATGEEVKDIAYDEIAALWTS